MLRPVNRDQSIISNLENISFHPSLSCVNSFFDSIERHCFSNSFCSSIVQAVNRVMSFLLNKIWAFLGYYSIHHQVDVGQEASNRFLEWPAGIILRSDLEQCKVFRLYYISAISSLIMSMLGRADQGTGIIMRINGNITPSSRDCIVILESQGNLYNPLLDANVLVANSLSEAQTEFERDDAQRLNCVKIQFFYQPIRFTSVRK